MGHISYLVIRLGPVYKTGGVYLTSEQKHQYASLSDQQRLGAVIQGTLLGYAGYMTLAFELALLVTLSALLLWMRGVRLIHQLGGVGGWDVGDSGGAEQATRSMVSFLTTLREEDISIPVKQVRGAQSSAPQA
eukprot:gene25252-30494_t